MKQNFLTINSLSKLFRKSIHSIDIQYINRVYDKEALHLKKRINDILLYNSNSVNYIAENERAFPGNEEFMASGYYHTMLKRYIFAGAEFCRGKNVLDSCCGLGWGTYLLSEYARSIRAFDIDNNIIQWCKKNWLSNNIIWAVGDALEMTFVENGMYDVVLAMETIEHFSKEDGDLLIKLLSDKLKVNGYLLGTSSFPITRDEAYKLCLNNPYHLHILTYDEMNSLLSKYFKTYKIINNWMFIARK